MGGSSKTLSPEPQVPEQWEVQAISQEVTTSVTSVLLLAQDTVIASAGTLSLLFRCYYARREKEQNNSACLSIIELPASPWKKKPVPSILATLTHIRQSPP
jgi:hypothetical protein